MSRTNFQFRFWSVFAPVAMLILLIFFWLYDKALERVHAEYRSQAELKVSNATRVLEKDLTLIIRDVRYLANNELTKAVLLSNGQPQALQVLAEDWKTLMSVSNAYDQIRWIDTTGHERLRINLQKGHPSLVPSGQLQDKSQRYYVRETLRLEPQAVYLSPMDLNIENNEIEKPFKPTIRVGSSLFDAQGKNHGAIIVNYNATEMLQKLGELRVRQDRFLWLVNQEGYWLKSSKVSDEWGFMFNKPNLTLGTRYPEAWQELSKGERGTFETSNGLWSFQTIQPLALANSNHHVGSVFTEPGREEYTWRVVHLTPRLLLNQAISEVQQLWFGVLLSLLGLLFWGSWSLARIRQAEVHEAEVYARHEVLLHEAQALNAEIEHRKDVEQDLFLSLERYSGVIKGTPEGFLLLDYDAQIIEVNDAFCDLLQMTADTLVGQNIDMFSNVLDIDDLKDRLNHLAKRGSDRFDLRAKLNHGQQKIISVVMSDLVKTRQICAFLRDITQEKADEFQLKMAASVFTHAKEGIILTDANYNIIDVNEEFEKITGFTKAEVLGKSPKMLRSGRQPKAFYDQMKTVLAKSGDWSGELWNRRKTGEFYIEQLSITKVTNNDDGGYHYVGMFTDVTLEKQYQKRLEHISHFDGLTGLPNRMLLTDRITQAIAGAHRKHNHFSVIFIDLDGFKSVNDEHGHEMGDALLVHVAKVIRSLLRETDTIARFGGDEFVAVIQDLDRTDAIIPLLKRLLRQLSEPVTLSNIVVSVSASIGVTFFPQGEALDGEQLIRQADQAMYIAKQAGKNSFHIFDIDHDKNLRHINAALKEIERAIMNDEFVLHYQPKVMLSEQSVVGLEVLIRWEHPHRGMLYPNEFLPILEQHTYSIKLSEWVIRAALKQMSDWQAEGLTIAVSVNLGSVELQQQDFIQWLKSLLNEFPEIHPSMLEIEVLETSALADIVHVSALIEQCRNLGVMFALDDFGTGFASLSYLKKLPLESIKIDQSFVRNMFDEEEDIFILEGMIGLAKSLNRQVIAEGIETEAHGLTLLKLGCRLGQGYFIAKPMPSQLVHQWIVQWQPPESWLDVVPSRDYPIDHLIS